MTNDSSSVSFALTDLAKIIDLAPSFMVVMRGPQLIVEVANKAYYQLVGHRQLIGVSIRKAFPEVEGQGFFELLNEVYKSGTAWVGSAVPIQLQRVPGSPLELRYLDIVYQVLRGPDGAVTGIFAHGVDITERKVAEESLRQAAEAAVQQARVYDLTLSSVTDFVYAFDREGRFLFSNKPLLDLLQVSLDSLVSKNFFDLGYPEDLAGRLQRQIQPVFTSGEIVVDETPFVSPSGQPGFYEYILSPVLDTDGRITQVAGITRDITERKNAEQALVESDRRKSDFLAMLAHELRNPLAPIRNGVDFLRQAGGGHAKVPALLNMMDRQITQVVRLIDDLMDVSRISRGKIELRREHFELAPVINQAVEAAQPSYDHMKQDLTVTLPARPVRLSGDPARLAQVIGNLLNNACKFSDRGGHVNVTVERNADQAIVRVRDNGIGIAAKDRERIFEMFTQLDTAIARSKGGLGIGLTLVKDLVEMHGGAVEVHSEGLGRGSEFVLRLPVLEDQVPLLQEPHVRPAGFIQRRVLVVDDNADVTDMLAALLEFSGHQVDIAHDGVEAVEAAIRIRPNAVLLDIGVPRLDGYGAARQIREKLGNGVLLIAITGWGQDEDRHRAREAGFDQHMTKPVDYDKLTKSLTEWGAGDLQSA